MSELDPEDSSPAGPNDTQSSDQSKSKLRAAWDAWTSRPENNAALLQAGIAMLQPRAPGQSALGQFANAVGSGAEASDRNVAAQRAEADAAAARSVKEREAGSREVTANAYAQSVKDQATGRGKGSSLTTTMRQQMEFNKWLRAPSDPLAQDPVVAALQRKFPDIKSKGDLLANPAARQEAFRLFASAGGGGDSEDDGGTESSGSSSGSVSPTPQQAPAAKPIRRYNSAGQGVEWNGKAWVPIPTQ